MAGQLPRMATFLLWSLVLIGCKTGADKPPLRLENLLSKQSANSIKNAMTIHPKVIPAADPTSLASKTAPLSPELYVSAAAVLEQQNRNAEAAQKYDQALAVEPSHRDALIGLARLRHREGNLESAVEVYQRALQVYPEDAVLLNDLGLCYARAGQSQNAIAVLQRAVEMSPSSTLYRNNLAAALVEADRSGEAVPLLAQTCGTAVAHYNVGYLLHKRGANGAAVEHFVASLEANPSLTPARSMLQQLAPQMSQLPIRTPQPPVGQPTGAPHSRGPAASAPPSDNQDSPPTWPTRPASYSVEVTTAEPVVAEPLESVDPGKVIFPEAALDATVEEPTEFPIPRLLRLPLANRASRKAGHLVPPAPRPVRPAFRAEFLPTLDDATPR